MFRRQRSDLCHDVKQFAPYPHAGLKFFLSLRIRHFSITHRLKIMFPASAAELSFCIHFIFLTF